MRCSLADFRVNVARLIEQSPVKTLHTDPHILGEYMRVCRWRGGGRCYRKLIMLQETNYSI